MKGIIISTCNFSTWKAEAEMLSFSPTNQQKIHNKIISPSLKTPKQNQQIQNKHKAYNSLTTRHTSKNGVCILKTLRYSAKDGSQMVKMHKKTYLPTFYH